MRTKIKMKQTLQQNKRHGGGYNSRDNRVTH